MFYNVHVSQLILWCIAHWGIDGIPQRGHDYVYVMYRLSLVDVYGKKSFKFLCMLLIMYGIKQVYRLHVRLATGPGGLKPIWILAPVAVRFSGRYRMVSEP